MANYNLTGQKIKNTYGQVAQVNDDNKLVDGLGNEKQIVTGSIQNFDTEVSRSAAEAGFGAGGGAIDTSSLVQNATFNAYTSSNDSAVSVLDTRVDSLTAATSSYLTSLPSGVVSGSSQISYSGITDVPSNIVSSSAQTITNLPSGTISGSSQVDLSSATGTAANATSASYAVSASHLIGGSGGAAGLVAGTGTDSMRSSDDLTTTAANASANDSIALGSNARATAANAIAIGENQRAGGQRSTIIGLESDDNANNEVVAIGYNNDATQRRAVGIGLDNIMGGDSCIVIGNSNSCNGGSGIVLGVGSQATSNSITIGGGGANSSQYGITIGDGAAGGGQGSVVIGRNGAGDFNGAVAIGQNATAQATNAIVIGNGQAVSVQENDNEINIGGKFRFGYNDTASIHLADVVNLPSQDPLPSGHVGDLAVSASALYFHNGTSWSSIS